MISSLGLRYFKPGLVITAHRNMVQFFSLTQQLVKRRWKYHWLICSSQVEKLFWTWNDHVRWYTSLFDKINKVRIERQVNTSPGTFVAVAWSISVWKKDTSPPVFPRSLICHLYHLVDGTKMLEDLGDMLRIYPTLERSSWLPPLFQLFLFLILALGNWEMLMLLPREC